MNATDVQRTDWLMIAALGLAIFVAQLDGTAVNIALPAIERDFGVSTSLTQWVVLGYVLPMVALSLPAGRWLDTVGRRPALVLAMTLFVLASITVGLSPGMAWLLGARAAQGAAAAVLFALVPVLTTDAAAAGRLGRAMSLVLVLGMLGGVGGPVLGGLLVEMLGWEWIFFLNAPVGLAVVAIGLFRLPVTGPLRLPARRSLFEVVLLAGATAALLGALTLTADRGVRWLPLALAAVPFVIVWQRDRSSAPIRDVLSTPELPALHIGLLAEMAAISGLLLVLPFHLQGVGGATAAEAGFALLAFPLMTMLTGPLAGVLADRWPPRAVATIGTTLITVGLVLIAGLSAGWGPFELSWRLAIIGIGAGLFAGPNQVAAMSAAPERLRGTVGASTSVTRQLGMALGPAIATATWAALDYSSGGMRAAVALSATCGLVATIALMPRHTKTSTAASAQVSSLRR